MHAHTLWDAYCRAHHVPSVDYDAWSFGDDPDTLADLVFHGIKTATCSLRCLYDLDGEVLPTSGEYSVILNTQGEAVCIIRTTRVFITRFCDVTADFARREGEGDRSLAYWRRVHEAFFGMSFVPPT